MNGKHRRLSTLAWQIGITAAVLIVWQWGYSLSDRYGWLIPDILDPYFISKPSEIVARFLRMGCFVSFDGHWNGWSNGEFAQCLVRNENNLWVGSLVTLKNTIAGFAVGVSSGVLIGLMLGCSDRLAEIFNPFIVAFNSVPRVALVPLIVLAFGLGDSSKIVTAWAVVFFLVFFNTFEGARAVDRDLVSASRLLGANSWRTTLTVIVPSTMGWVFASLSPAISFSLIGVIVGEFIGAERGIGRVIIEAEAKGDAAGMMVAVFVLMVVGVVLTTIIRRIQSHLLRWQAQYQAAA